ncbi:hypothetical protein HWV62_16748 [Athelia sp. TMB]|nr:hypothetical protein HWV62_16748 [Athelia sp. TMB]
MSEKRSSSNASHTGTKPAIGNLHKDSAGPSHPTDDHPTPTFFGRCKTFASDPRSQMAVAMIIGGLLMFGHHSLLHYLNGRLVEKTYEINDHKILASVKSIFRSQQVVSALSNLIANCERIVLTMAIGIAFIQVLWMFLRKNHYSIEQIDNFMATRSSAFTPSSFATLCSSAFVLTLMALCATAMTTITVLAPGALSILPEQLILNSSCTVPTVDVASADYGAAVLSGPGVASWPGIAQLVARVIVQEQPFLPTNQYITCNSSCQYNIEYIAPAIQCTDASDSVNFNVTLPNLTTNATVNGPGLATVYNSSYTWGSDGVSLIVSMVQGNYRDGAWSFQAPQAFSCTAYNATYGVTVLYTADSLAAGTVTLNYKNVYNRLPGKAPVSSSNITTNQIVQMNSIVDAFAFGMQGTITYGSKGYLGDATPTAVQYSNLSAALIGNANITDWTTIIPNLMQQTSLSLISGSFDIYGGAISILPHNTTCASYANTYHYTPWRLLVTYGVCIGAAALCVLYGWWAVYHNKRGEALGFRRLLESARDLYSTDTSDRAATEGRLPVHAKLQVTARDSFQRHDLQGEPSTLA